jgi:hypothetical protein
MVRPRAGLQGEALEVRRVPSFETALKQTLGGEFDPVRRDESLSGGVPSISYYCGAARRFLKL